MGGALSQLALQHAGQQWTSVDDNICIVLLLCGWTIAYAIEPLSKCLKR